MAGARRRGQPPPLYQSFAVSMARAAALETAATIARALCTSAHVHEGRHAWMGTTQGGGIDGRALAFTYGTVGADLYGGTAGIGLALAETYRLTNERASRDAAIGALQHALSRTPRLVADRAYGFYDGVTGIAYAAARVAACTGESAFMDEARALLASLRPDALDSMGLDVIDGAAGAAPPMLLLAEHLGLPTLADCARHLGSRIVAAAERGDDGWSWRYRGRTESINLTGLSHGASGMGWALLELHRATGEAEFHRGAQEAFRYERKWFRAGEDNWPDFRDLEGDPSTAPCAMAWCHGAPGIGLTRLRAMALDGDALIRADALAAVRGVKRALTSRAPGDDRDATPCHGLAGLCSFLLDAAHVLDDADARKVALAAAAAAARHHGRRPDDWPCGVQRGSNPSLMIGLAGIAHFYLRIADPAVPGHLLVSYR